tara:strand:+ start:6513 stop:7442 length:930 start_codon:yes stop_codon:yes gene_type:complete
MSHSVVGYPSTHQLKWNTMTKKKDVAVKTEESKDLILKNLTDSLPIMTAKPEYQVMAANIEDKLPAVQRDTSNFHKSHSQFMGVTLDVTAITPIRSIKHTLAEIDKTRSALQEAFISVEKKKIEIQMKEREISECEDDLQRKLSEVELLEMRSHLESTNNHMQGALRKMNFFVNQHDNLLKALGRDEISEEEYEEEEVKYHIMTAMKQALNAARSRNGIIDEGNLIYIFDLGINAAQAQAEVLSYLQWENELVKQGKAPEHHHTVQWLEGCAEKWKHCPTDFANSRGFQIMDRTSLTNTPLLKEASDAA